MAHAQYCELYDVLHENIEVGQFKIAAGGWYGWQMIPGYLGQRCEPYFSPILVHQVTPLKTGKRLVRLQFANALYAQGAQDFDLDLRVIHQAGDYLVAEIMYSGSMAGERCAVISHIEFGWLERFCPSLWEWKPPSACSSAAQNSVSLYLDEIFLQKRG